MHRFIHSTIFSRGIFRPEMSIHRDSKVCDQYEILNYIGQGTYANVCERHRNVLVL